MTDPLYYTKGREVWKSPVRTRIEGGESVSIGFHACTASEVVGEEGATAIAALLCLGEEAQAAPPQTNLAVTLDRKLGGYGAAYDPPGPQRAYTYQHSPHNGPAYQLGCAVSALRQHTTGDAIDIGLYLLKELQARGFGVFEIEPKAVEEAPHQDHAQARQ